MCSDHDYFASEKWDPAGVLDERKYYAVTPIERGLFAFVMAAVAVSITMGNAYLFIGFVTALLACVIAVFFHPLRRRLRAMRAAEERVKSPAKTIVVTVAMWAVVFMLIIIFSAWTPPEEWLTMVGYIAVGLCSIAATQLALNNV